MKGGRKERATRGNTGQHGKAEITETLLCFLCQARDYPGSRHSCRGSQAIFSSSELYRCIQCACGGKQISDDIDAIQGKIWMRRPRGTQGTERHLRFIEHVLKFPGIVNE